MANFLAAIQFYLRSKQCYIEDDFSYDELQLHQEAIKYQDLRANKIIFCEGAQGIHNPFFKNLPFKLVKGELLIAEVDEKIDMISSQGIYIVPHSNKKILIGATYDWDDLSLTPTINAREKLEAKLQKILPIPYKILSQQIGIRPATFDRRPLIGLHPVYNQIGIFNGMGSKGVSLAPYLSKRFVQYLLYGQELPEEVRISRIQKLKT